MAKTSTPLFINNTGKQTEFDAEPRTHIIKSLLSFSKSLEVKKSSKGRKIECFNN
jgi:hypothetical protein